MDLTFFPARAKWRSSQSPRRGVPWLCLTGADIVRDGVISRLHSKSPDSKTSLCSIRGLSPRLSVRLSSSYYKSSSEHPDC